MNVLNPYKLIYYVFLFKIRTLQIRVLCLRGSVYFITINGKLDIYSGNRL